MNVLWRIAVETPAYPVSDLSGTGARITGGRWNSQGAPVVYCSTSIALATLETVHYLRGGGLPFNRYLVRIAIPDGVWNARQVLDPFPGGWDAIPAGLSGKRAGDGGTIGRSRRHKRDALGVRWAEQAAACAGGRDAGQLFG